MTFRQLVIVGFLLALGATLWSCGEFSGERLRQRFTLEVTTPDGDRSASSVTVASAIHQRWIDRSNLELTGEATFLDLGAGRLVIAILDGAAVEGFKLAAGGARGMNHDLIRAARASIGKSFPVPVNRLPTLVTFTDLANPATAKVVPPTAEGFAAAFGPGFAFKRATVEIVPGGILPFSLIPLGWPQWLFGAPVTRGIEARLPKWTVTSYDDVRNPDGSRLSPEQRNFLININRGFVRKL